METQLIDSTRRLREYMGTRRGRKISSRELQSACGVPSGTLSSAMVALELLGEVEHPARGWYRMNHQKVQAAPVPVPAPGGTEMARIADSLERLIDLVTQGITFK